MLMLIASTLLLSLPSLTDGHGRLIEPPGRSTMWRYGYNTEHNTNDHQLSCGGFGAQFYRNKGKCGICGDPYSGPRDNEAGGLYAKGIIVRKWKKGDIVIVKTEITVNHLGWFEFRLCPNNNPKKAATQDCLDKYLLKQPTGATRYHMAPGNGVMAVQLQLPEDLTCTQCVLQWKWNTASNIGFDGKEWCRGCGPQEQFYGCADVSISASGSSSSGKVDTGYKPPQPHVPATVVNRPQLVPTNNNVLNSLPGSFVPLHNSNNQVPPPNNNNQGLPHGLIKIPVDETSDSCKANDFWREKFEAADDWCRQNCKHGLCPKDYCEESCQKLLITI